MKKSWFSLFIPILGWSCATVSNIQNKTQPIVLSDDGGWCWFESPRAIIHDDKLLIGSVASGSKDSSRKGDVDLIVHDFKAGQAQTVKLHEHVELDDHDSPALLRRTDGRWIAIYAKHHMERHLYYRISEPNDALHWGPVRTWAPSSSTMLTYANLFQLPAENGRIYDFYRGLDDSFKPSYAYSDDLGETWKSGNVFIRVPATQRHRPYVRYASNGTDTVHMLYTEAHPRDFDNSLYHIYYKNGQLHHSDGTVIASITKGLDAPNQGTLIYQGDRDHVAWCTEISLDSDQRPVAVYSLQVGSAGLPMNQGGDDLRYRYARWDGKKWNDHALAYAGTRLYSGEDDYSGLAAIDQDDPNIVYISTNADPVSGAPLMSTADGKRHYEIFRAQTRDRGETWSFSPITQNSTQDNLRPICPASNNRHRALIWLHGTYRAYTDYDQQVMAIFWQR